MKDDIGHNDDVLPAEPATKQPNPPSCAKSSCMRHYFVWLPMLLAGLALGMSAITLYGALCLKQRLHVAHIQLLQRIETVQQYAEKRIQTTHQTLKTQVDTLQKNINTLSHTTQYHTQDWQIVKARDYLQLAQFNTELYDNPATTRTLLEKANQLLAAVPETRIQTIRSHLEESISTFSAATPPNTQNVFNQLAILQSQTEKLKLNTLPSFAAATATKSEGTSWQARLKQTLTTFKQFIVIRHNINNTTQILSPLHHTILEDTLGLDFQMAQWAIMQKNTRLYQQALNHAEKNIQRYALLSDDTTRAMIETIDTLKKISIIPPRWDEKALLELNDYLKS